MTSSASHGRAKSHGRLPIAGLGAGLLLVLLSTACPGTLPEDIKKYDAGGTGTGGIGGGGTGGSTPLPPCDAPVMVFQKDVTAAGCLGSACHSGLFPPDFRTATKASLAAQTATGIMGCMGMPLVNTANPTASVILKRVQGATCGEQMPSKSLGATAFLDQPAIDCIAGWVMAP